MTEQPNHVLNIGNATNDDMERLIVFAHKVANLPYEGFTFSLSTEIHKLRKEAGAILDKVPYNG